MIANIQINIDGRWIDAAAYNQKDIGHIGYLEYDMDYFLSFADKPALRVGLNYPISLSLNDSDVWPAFLYDILPSGAGRRVWLRRLGLRDNDSPSDWTLLLQGAGNPPGNLRVKSAAIVPPEKPHPGFTREEIVDKNADFIEYAEAMGAVVAGASDVQGDAPKFLLVRDHNKRWHPDGSLFDSDILDSWIVKFPRGKDTKDYQVLRNEAGYYEVARHFGINVGEPLYYENNALFIPRFDREKNGERLIRHGLESLSSAAGVPGYGKRGDHLEFCKSIAKFSTNKESDLFEYLKRDILNTALRNTDNHGRNTAFLKRSSGDVTLSPLYDFAPMFLDPQGIARASIWNDEALERKGSGRPNWKVIAEALSGLLDSEETEQFMSLQSNAVRNLPAVMKEVGIEEDVILGVKRRCEEIAEDLAMVII